MVPPSIHSIITILSFHHYHHPFIPPSPPSISPSLHSTITILDFTFTTLHLYFFLKTNFTPPLFFLPHPSLFSEHTASTVTAQKACFSTGLSFPDLLVSSALDTVFHSPSPLSSLSPPSLQPPSLFLVFQAANTDVMRPTKCLPFLLSLGLSWLLWRGALVGRLRGI